MKRVLLISNPNSGHTQRFLKILRATSDDIVVDLFCDFPTKKVDKVANYCDKVYNSEFHLPKLICMIPKVYGFLHMRDFLKNISQIPTNAYDVVNIHFVGASAIFANKEFHRVGRKILLSPLGSDVLRASQNRLKKLQLVYDMADGVTLSPKGKGFYVKVKKQFNIPDNKIFKVGFGSDVIDSMSTDNRTKEEVKETFNLRNRYVISIGYNGSREQRHTEVIRAIIDAKPYLSQNLTVVIPATYPSHNEEYLNSLKELLGRNNIDYKIIEGYLDIEKIVALRKCSDMFIHAQMTDAGSASMMEYMLSDAVIINGEWLSYPEFEEFGMPYLTFSDFKQLTSRIKEGSNIRTLVSDELREYISKRGWRYEIQNWIRCYNTL